MTEFDKDKFLQAFAAAKLMAHITRSTDPKKNVQLDRLQDLADQAFDLATEIVESLGVTE